MNKFIDEEKNMLENDPEIRDPSLRTKPSFLDKLLWKRWYKGATLTSLAITIPAVLASTLTACTPKVDEVQQRAYKYYLSAWSQYENATAEYNKVENPDKPSLPANLVLNKTLDEKATTESLKKETDTVKKATADIIELTQFYKNNDAHSAAYKNYLSAWDTYTDAVVEYNMLENEEKPEELPANLVLAKTLDDKATTEELNKGRTALENATAEINKLIKQYEQETPTPPEPDKPMTKEEIVEKVTSAVETAVKNVLGRNATSIEYLAIDYKEESGKFFVDILTEYNTVVSGVSGETRRLVRIPMQTEMTEENLKNGTFLPTGPRNGQTLIDIPMTSQDTRDREVLAKLNPAMVETNPKFVSLTNTSGGVVTGIGGTNEIKIFVIDDNGVTIIKTYARSDGDRTDPIGQSILAENAEIGKDYTSPTTEKFAFGDNVILLGEMFKEDDSNEVLDVFEHKEQTYAIIRNRYTELKKGVESESY